LAVATMRFASRRPLSSSTRVVVVPHAVSWKEPAHSSPFNHARLLCLNAHKHPASTPSTESGRLAARAAPQLVTNQALAAVMLTPLLESMRPAARKPIVSLATRNAALWIALSATGVCSVNGVLPADCKFASAHALSPPSPSAMAHLAHPPLNTTPATRIAPWIAKWMSGLHGLCVLLAALEVKINKRLLVTAQF
jgi:hypothetical protein